MKHILTILLEKFLLLLVKLGQRVLGDGPEVVVEDHLAEDGVTSEEPADVPIVTVTPSQEDHVWLTLNRGSERIFNLRFSIEFYKVKRFLDISNYLRAFLVDMFNECLLIVAVVRYVGDSKLKFLQMLLMKEASISIVEIRNIWGIQWPRLRTPIF